MLLIVALIPQSSKAQTITENFGSGTNAFSIDFVTIGNPGNVADNAGAPNPAGSVNYYYNIGKYEVSRDQIIKANLDGGLGITLSDMSSYGANGGNMPATGISWLEAAKYVNYLNTSHGSSVAYKISGNQFTPWGSTEIGYNPNNNFRNTLAKFFLPTVDEWYKAAYGSPNGTWYKYSTGSDTAPTVVDQGTDPNTAVWNNRNSPAPIDNAGGLSPYGTMAQGGNVFEWNETISPNNNSANVDYLIIRGGAWGYGIGAATLDSSSLSHGYISLEYEFHGFRVASVPEPSALSLLVVGLGVVLRHRRRTV